MKKNDIIEKEELITDIDKVTGKEKTRHLRVKRKCVRILCGYKSNPNSKLMEYEDVSNKDIDVNDGKRYIIIYDNISETEIP